MAKKTTQVVAGFEVVGADKAKQDFKGIQTAAENFGDAGKKGAQGVTDQFKNVEKQMERVIAKISDGRAVTTNDGALMIQAFTQLGDEIEATFGSIEKAPQEIQEAFKKAEAQLNATTAKVRDLTDDVADQKDRLKEGGAAWHGFGQNLNQVLGPMGKVQMGALAIAAALTEGWKMGTQFAKAIGTDFQAFDQAAESVKKSTGSIINALTSEGFGAAFTQARAHFKFLGDTVAGSGTEMLGYNAVVAAGVSRTDALKLSTDALTAVAQAHALATQGGTEAIRLFQTTIATSDPSEYAAKLEALKGTFEGLRDRAKELNEAETLRRAAVEENIKSIDTIIAALERERVARKLGLDQLDSEMREMANLKKAYEDNAVIQEAAKHVKDGMTEAMRTELEQIKQLLPAYEDNKEQVQNLVEAYEADIELHRGGLTEEQEKHHDRIADLASRYGDLDQAEKGELERLIESLTARRDQTKATSDLTYEVTDATGKTTTLTSAEDAAKAMKAGLTVEIRNTKDAAAESNIVFDKAAGTMVTVGEKINEAKTGHISFADTLKAGKQPIIDFGAELDKLIGKLAAVATAARDTAGALKDVGAAAGEAAGDEGSDFHKPTLPQPAKYPTNNNATMSPAPSGITPSQMPRKGPSDT